MLQWQFTLLGIAETDTNSCIWNEKPQSWLGARICHQTLTCILPGKRMKLKSSTWETQGLQYNPSALSLLQMLSSNFCLSVRMNFFLLDFSKHSTNWYQTGRRNKVISTLPKTTFGLFSLAFTRQHIIKQKFQSRLLMPISTPLSSMPESGQCPAMLTSVQNKSFQLASVRTVLHMRFFWAAALILLDLSESTQQFLQRQRAIISFPCQYTCNPKGIITLIWWRQ